MSLPIVSHPFPSRPSRSGVLVLVLAWVVSGVGCTGLEGMDLGGLLLGTGPLDEGTAATGLKQALQVGTERTTSTLSEPGGFASDPNLRLRLPGELGQLAQALRTIGLGAQVDALEASMNEAAEQAAARAAPVFVSAVASMSIVDAFAILNGPEDAATRYFRDRTSETLRARFEPVVTASMAQVGLYGLYAQLVARYEAIPFATKRPSLDLEAYVTNRTLDGLFSTLATEEARIREDPGARTTALLRRVFGAREASR
jgi:hypothetical protein